MGIFGQPKYWSTNYLVNQSNKNEPNDRQF